MRGSREKAVSPHQGWQNQKFYHFPNTTTTAKTAVVFLSAHPIFRN